MKASVLVLFCVLFLGGPTLAQAADMYRHIHHRTSRHVARMRHRDDDDGGVSVVTGSEVKRNDVGEIIAPRVESITPIEKSITDPPKQTTPPAPAPANNP